MSKLVLIGGGGHCKSVLDVALSLNKYKEIVITDPETKPGTEVHGCTVVGNDDILPELRSRGFDEAFISVGSIESCSLRIRLSELAEQLGFRFPVISDPSAVISKNAVIGNGSFVGKNAVINTDVSLGKHSIINTSAVIEHECSVGDYSHISVGALVCGGTVIGDRTFIGAGATIIQGLKIGDDSIIGAGSTVLSDIQSGKKIYGVIHEEN